MPHALLYVVTLQRSPSVRSLLSAAPRFLPARQFQIPLSIRATELPRPLLPPPHPCAPQIPPSISLDKRLDNWQPPMFHNAAIVCPEPEYLSYMATNDKAELLSKRMPWSDHATAPAGCSQIFFPSIFQSPNHPIAKSLNLYRSISPSTISMLPIAATTSAISPPSHILGSVCRFARQAARMCTR